MAVGLQRITREEFEAWLHLPENAERRFELLAGEITEVPSNTYSSHIALMLGAALVTYIKGKNLGFITGEAGMYTVSGEYYAPDVAFMSKARQAALPRDIFNPLAPDLAVEVVSPSDVEKNLRVKVANYLAAGTVVWVIYPQTQQAEIYAPGQPVQMIDASGSLEGGSVIPGFTLPLRDLFTE